MTVEPFSAPGQDRFGLTRFVAAQAPVIQTVLKELRGGKKRTHWMWYVFPQLDGLGESVIAKHYAIKSADEARAYLNHPLLGARLRECTSAVCAVEGRTVSEIFGFPDDLKFKSSMTLFASVAAEPNSIFVQALTKYFAGEKCERTLGLLASPSS